MSSKVPIIAQAVEIRRAVQPLLLHDVADPRAWTRAAAADAAAWRLFLGTERCALPLAQALGLHPGVEPGEGGGNALAQAVQIELLQVSVARAHLRRVAALAAQQDVTVIVLKGGALALHDPIGMADVDVLLPRHEIARLAEALSQQQLEPLPYHSDRVPRMMTGGGMALELHQGLGLRGELDEGVWARSEPLPGMPPLRQLGALDNVRHVAQHVALDHSNRRVRLRDLYLLRRSAGRCRREELAALWAAPGASYVERTQRLTLDAVLTRAQDERLEREALFNYVLATRTRLPFVARDVHELVNALAVMMCHSKWETRKLLSGMHVVSDVPSSRPFISTLERVVPPLGHALRHAMRVSGVLLTRGLAWAVLTTARVRARQVRRSLSA